VAAKADSMQEVVPRICMGSAVAAKNLDLLQQHGITHIIAIGWNLEKHYEDKYTYLLINRVEDSPEEVILLHLAQCFAFIDQCLATPKGRLFVHCHKGLSRSATVVIAYEMARRGGDFDSVLKKIRESRSFIMPNIGFQAQLHEFERQNYSLDMTRYGEFNVLNFIKERLPKMLAAIRKNYAAYQGDDDEVDENELFELTLYTHQVHKLRQKEKLNDKDIEILKESISILRQIQVEFVGNEQSLKRFDIMFRESKRNQNKATSKAEQQHSEYVQASSLSKASPTLGLGGQAGQDTTILDNPIAELDLKEEESQTLIATTT